MQGFNRIHSQAISKDNDKKAVKMNVTLCKEGSQKPDKSERRLDMNLLVNTGQIKEASIDSVFIWLAIKAQSFVCCLQEPAWQQRHAVASN